MLEATIQRLVTRLWPELTGQLHLPHWGRIVSTPPAIDDAAQSTASTPLYAVDVQLLDAQGKDDIAMPVLKAVPLPVTGAGDARGLLGFPAKDTLVELGFIRGLPSKPFIRTVLIENRVVSALGSDELLLQHSEGVFQRATDNGDWLRTTKAAITDTSQNHTEHIEKIKNSLAGLQQRIAVADGGTVWLGSESVNVLQVLSDLTQVVADIAKTTATHTHPNVGACSQGAAFSGFESAAGKLKGQVDPIKA